MQALSLFVTSAAGSDSARRRLFADDAAQGVALLELLRMRFDVVLMNPPFGAGSTKAKKLFDASYPKTKNDVYAAFVERGIQLLVSRGMLGAITSRTGFFLSSFQKWREDIILDTAPPLVFADLGQGVLDGAMVEVAAYCLERVALTRRSSSGYRVRTKGAQPSPGSSVRRRSVRGVSICAERAGVRADSEVALRLLGAESELVRSSHRVATYGSDGRAVESGSGDRR